MDATIKALLLSIVLYAKGIAKNGISGMLHVNLYIHGKKDSDNPIYNRNGLLNVADYFTQSVDSPVEFTLESGTDATLTTKFFAHDKDFNFTVKYPNGDSVTVKYPTKAEYKTDADGKYIREVVKDKDGNPVPVYSLDADGNPVKDANGNPVISLDDKGQPIYKTAKVATGKDIPYPESEFRLAVEKIVRDINKVNHPSLRDATESDGTVKVKLNKDVRESMDVLKNALPQGVNLADVLRAIASNPDLLKGMQPSTGTDAVTGTQPG